MKRRLNLNLKPKQKPNRKSRKSQRKAVSEVERKVEGDQEVDHEQNQKADGEVVQGREAILGVVQEVDREVDQEAGIEVEDQEVVQNREVEGLVVVRVQKVEVDLDQNPGQERYPSAGGDLCHVTILIRPVTS